MKKIRWIVLLMALVLAVGAFVACGETSTTTPGSSDDQTPPDSTPGTIEYQEIDDKDAVTHTDFTSVYDKIGSKVTINMVEEAADGKAYVTVDGVKYELGMDFLSMAMVYNMTVPTGSDKWKTETDVYNTWWKLYIQRWNYQAVEVPLYSNQYFDIYNAKIQNFKTSPYWGVAEAIVGATIKTGETNSVILGSVTDLSGAFRNSSWGKSNPGASDLDIQKLTSGHATMASDKDGIYRWNMTVLASEPTSKMNENGTLTFTVTIKEGLKFSDGSAITAKNYIASMLANSTVVSEAAGGTGQAGLTFVGYDDFYAYEGNGDTVYFQGIQLLSDTSFALTIVPDYANYYYAETFAAVSPTPLTLYLGAGDVVVDPDTKTCGLNAAFYEKVTVDGKETYKTAEAIKKNLEWNSNLPYSGPYVVENYDASTRTATLKLNPNYPGDDQRGKASIERITYVKIVSETQLDQFTTGKVDVLAGVTGGDDTKAALDAVNKSGGKFAETHYDRAGFGKLAFRCDYGPTNMVEVRQAIMYTINRPEFAQNFTGGYGTVVHGPYYEGCEAYIANKDTILLNQYQYSSASAIRVLKEGGWIYNEKGQAFREGTDTIRYKKLSGYELSVDNLHFQSIDGKYKTVKINGEYYMPLAINWYGTQPNDVTDRLITSWQTNPNATTSIGMYITYTSADFGTALYAEYLRLEPYGYDGTPKLNAVNYAVGYNSTIYDYAFNWTINPQMYPIYSSVYLMDEADFASNYTK